jgi:hypothetical protein
MSQAYDIDQDQPIQILIDGETPAGSTRRSTGGGGDHGAAELQRERMARVQAERQNQLIAAQNAMTEAKLEADLAERDFAAASETGDFAKQANASRRMSSAEARLAEAEGRVGYLQRQPAQPQQQYSSRASEWFNKNPEYLSDARKNSMVIGAHHMAIGEGHVPDSDDYYRYVESKLGIHGNGTGPSRNGGGDGRSVTLSKSEVEMANSGAIVWNVGDKDLNGQIIRSGDPRVGTAIGTKAYGYRKLQMQKAGFMDRL